VKRAFEIASQMFSIPEQSLQSFVIDLNETSSLEFVFGLVMEFPIQGV
jgi:hypothetical protein